MTKKTIFAGFGGQGVLFMGYLYALAVMNDGLEVTYLPSYGAEVRGGTANCTVVVSDEEIASPVASFPDYAVVLNKPSMLRFEGVIRAGGEMLINSSLVDVDTSRSDIDVTKIPAYDIAKELKNERAVNMIMLGAFVARNPITTLDSIIKGLDEVQKGKGKKLKELNVKALKKGYDYIKRQKKGS